MLDTDTLTCVKECNSPKTIINDSQFSVSNICRGNDFYVDSSSSSVLEIGNRDHPYKSMKALMSEILNHHSNQGKEINIFLKSNERAYLEDGTNHIINITVVKIQTYSDEADDSSKAILMPTKVDQSNRSKTSAFSILRDSELRLDEVLAESGISDYEIGLMDLDDTTINLIRSNLVIENVIVQREQTDFGLETIFLFPIYLQDKLVNMTNVEINITGQILQAYDPLSLHLVNIMIELYGLGEGFFVNCI